MPWLKLLDKLGCLLRPENLLHKSKKSQEHQAASSSKFRAVSCIFDSLPNLVLIHLHLQLGALCLHSSTATPAGAVLVGKPGGTMLQVVSASAQY